MFHIYFAESVIDIYLGFFVLAANITGFCIAYILGYKVSTIADKTWELTSVAFLFQFIVSVLLIIAMTISEIPKYNIHPNANAGMYILVKNY